MHSSSITELGEGMQRGPIHLGAGIEALVIRVLEVTVGEVRGLRS